MKTRIEFMMPNLETSIQVRSALLAGLVENKDIHFLANQETNLADLNKANAARVVTFFMRVKKEYCMAWGLVC